MTHFSRLLLLVLSIASLPSLAKSSATTAKPNPDFHELIAKGERPEIAACVVAALDYIRQDKSYDALRWSEQNLENANLRENDEGGEITRLVRFDAKVRSRGGLVFTRQWQPAELSCVQHQDTPPEVRLRLLALP